jgi:hypothetical protein
MTWQALLVVPTINEIEVLALNVPDVPVMVIG